MCNVNVALARMLALDRRLRGEDGILILKKSSRIFRFGLVFKSAQHFPSSNIDIHFSLLGEGVHRNLGIIESLGLPCFAGFDARFKALEKAWLPFVWFECQLLWWCVLFSNLACGMTMVRAARNIMETVFVAVDPLISIDASEPSHGRRIWKWRPVKLLD